MPTIIITNGLRCCRQNVKFKKKIGNFKIKISKISSIVCAHWHTDLYSGAGLIRTIPAKSCHYNSIHPTSYVLLEWSVTQFFIQNIKRVV